MYVGVFGATVLMSGTGAFAMERTNDHFGNFGNNNQSQPRSQYYQNYYQNFFPQMNWENNRNLRNDNHNYNYQNNNNRDNNYLSNCNKEQYVDREDMNTNININSNGSVIIRNAVVNSINGNNVTLTSNLGGANLTWNMILDNQTRFESRNGRRIDVREILVGDKVMVKGRLMSGSSLTIDADLIRNTFRSTYR